MATTIIPNRAHAVAHDLPRRHYVNQILVDLFKFAVASAVDGSRKVIHGRKKEDKMVPEGLLNIPLPTILETKKKPDSKVANEICLESKMEEVMNNIKQQYKASVKHVKESEPPNQSGDDFKELNHLKKNERRVFIRSRL